MRAVVFAIHCRYTDIGIVVGLETGHRPGTTDSKSDSGSELLDLTCRTSPFPENEYLEANAVVFFRQKVGQECETVL